MTTNLARLEELFPGKLLLTPEEAASALGWDRKTIYRLRASQKLPFPTRRVGNLIVVPKLALAKWLDDGMPDAAPSVFETAVPEVPAEPVKKKRGRPRKALSVATFQAGLAAAWEHHTLSEAIKGAITALNPREDDNETRDIRDNLLNVLGVVFASRQAAEIEEGMITLETVKTDPPRERF